MHRLTAVDGAERVVHVRRDHAGRVDADDGGVEPRARQLHAELRADAPVLHRHQVMRAPSDSDLPRHGGVGDEEIRRCARLRIACVVQLLVLPSVCFGVRKCRVPCVQKTVYILL